MVSKICNYSLIKHNTFGLNAKANFAVWVNEENYLPEILYEIRTTNLPYLLIGEGSNIVFTKNFPGFVLFNRLHGLQIKYENEQAWFIEVAAGELWNDFVTYTIIENMPGLENLALIPGTVGAAPVQNMGAYGVEISDYLYSVKVFNLLNGKWQILKNTDCKFNYRDSIFKYLKNNHWFITAVTFCLPKKWKAKITHNDVKIAINAYKNIKNINAQDIFNIICNIRNTKLPDWRKIGNVGSFFKNPLVNYMHFIKLISREPKLTEHYMSINNNNVKLSAAWLIEQCGFKGVKRGNVGVHHAQALVIVNYGKATGNEIINLANEIIDAVLDRFGIFLEIEPKII